MRTWDATALSGRAYRLEGRKFEMLLAKEFIVMIPFRALMQVGGDEL